MSEDKGLETLQVWQKAMAFAKTVHAEVLPALPPEEKWVLGNQLRRSSQSIPANIGEGFGRYYFQETIRFCYIARGSLEESFTQIKLGQEFGYISEELSLKLENQIVELRRMLNGYITFLKKSKRGENEPGSASSFRETQADYLPDPNAPNP